LSQHNGARHKKAFKIVWIIYLFFHRKHTQDNALHFDLSLMGSSRLMFTWFFQSSFKWIALLQKVRFYTCTEIIVLARDSIQSDKIVRSCWRSNM
jgi:hypothetical protein